MAFFVGGQLVFGLAVVPLLRGEGDRERLRAVARRFGYGSLGALARLRWAKLHGQEAARLETSAIRK